MQETGREFPSLPEGEGKVTEVQNLVTSHLFLYMKQKFLNKTADKASHAACVTSNCVRMEEEADPTKLPSFQ